MIGDKLGRPIEEGQLVIVDSKLIGVGGLIECKVNSVNELLLPGQAPMKTVELVAVYRINVPITAAAIGGIYVVMDGSPEEKKPRLVEVRN